MLKPRAEKAARAGAFCVQAPPSSANWPPTLTAAVAVMAEAELKRRSPAVVKASDIRMPPVFVPSPMVSDAAEMPASSAVLKPRAVPDLLPRSMARALLKGLMVTFAPPAVPPAWMPPARVMLSACKVMLWPPTPLATSWLPLPVRWMSPAARLARRDRLPLPELSTPAPVMLAPDRLMLPPCVLTGAARLMFEPRPSAAPLLASFADRFTLPPFVLMAAYTLIVSPAVALRPTPAFTMLTALLKLMRCRACKVTLLLALEITSAPMLVLVAGGPSANWSTSPRLPPAPCTTSIS